MTEKSPGFDDWKKLYNTALKIKAIEPWKYMEECELFAVQEPETDKIGFVSIMGSIGEHYAISVYLEEKGFYGFMDFKQSRINRFSYQKLIEIPQLQVSFEDHNQLHSKDRAVIRKLGLKFRGKNSYPLFRSYRPGFYPWYLSQTEAQFLQCVLEQTIDVILRVQKEHLVVDPDEKGSFLIRKCVKKDGGIVWHDSSLIVEPPKPQPLVASLDYSIMDFLNRLKLKKMTVEMDLFIFPQPIKEKGTRPFYPYILMLVDKKSGEIIATETLQPLPTIESMWEEIPAIVAEIFANIKLLPKKIIVKSGELFQSLLYLKDEFGVSIELSQELSRIDEAHASLIDFMDKT